MKVLSPGHTYELSNLDGDLKQVLYFVNRNPGHECEGTVNQEVLRALIDRVKFLEDQVHWPLNEQILLHLRMALTLHEARALIRKTEKGLNVERFPVGKDGHYRIEEYKQ